MMLHGLGDCTPERNCGCMAKPPDVLRKRIARALWEADRDGTWENAGERWHLIYLERADAVIAALGPVETEWARAFERGDGSLFVDTEDDSYASYSDAAERTTLYDEHSPYDFVVSRYVTPWERIEEDA